MSVQSSEARRTINLRWLGETDYLESRIGLRSDSVVSPGSFAEAELGATLFNTLQADGGTDRTGDVYTSVAIRLSDDNLVTALYCADRSDNADFSEVTSLITSPENDRCGVFTKAVSLDTEYLMRLELDRENKQVNFSLDDESHTLDIAETIYATEDTFKAMRAIIQDGAGIAIAAVDDFRTTPSDSTTGPIDSDNDSGSGCTISSATNDKFDPLLLLMIVLATVIVLRQKGKNTSFTKCDNRQIF